MKRSATFLALTLLFALSSAVALADGPPAATGVVVRPGYGFGYGNGWGGYGRPYGASTVYGSYLRGQADLTRAQGEYNLNTSAAAINLEQARSMNLDNRVKYAETYFETRRINSSERAAERRPHATPEQITRWNESAKPARLSEAELGFVSDEVRWPAVLRDETFDAHRDSIETALAARTTENSGVGSDSHRAINATVEQMQETLKSKIRELPPTEYVAASKFLESLGYEARFEVGPVGLASTTR